MRTEPRQAPAKLCCEAVAPPEPTALLRFDAEVAWESLTPVQRREIGVAALVSSVGAMGRVARREQAFEIAEYVGFIRMATRVADAIEVPDGPPDLSVIGIRSCLVCGCCDEYGCAEGCHWVGPNLCSCCQRKAA